NVAGGVLVLPVVVYYGVPVILNVPELGYVDVPEDEYARLYDKLSSSDSEQVQEAMSSLRKLKELEEAEVEAAQHGPERMAPADLQDLSEPIFFGSPSRTETRRGGLYWSGTRLNPGVCAPGGPVFATDSRALAADV